MANISLNLNLEPTYDWFKFYYFKDILEDNNITCDTCEIVTVDGTDVPSTWWKANGIECGYVLGTFNVKYPTNDLLGQTVRHTIGLQYKETKSSPISSVTLNLTIKYPSTVTERLTGVHFKFKNASIDRSNKTGYAEQIYSQEDWNYLLNDLVEFEYSSGEDTYPRGNDFLQVSLGPLTRLHSWKKNGNLFDIVYELVDTYPNDDRYTCYGSNFMMEFKPSAKSGSDTLYLIYITPSGQKFTDSMTITMTTSNPNLIYARKVSPKNSVLNLVYTSLEDNSKEYSLDQVAYLYPEDATLSTITSVRFPEAPSPTVSRMHLSYNDNATTFGDFVKFSCPVWNQNDLEGLTSLISTWRHKIVFEGTADDAHTTERFNVSIKCKREQPNDPNNIESVWVTLYSNTLVPGQGTWVYCNVSPKSYVPQKITWEVLNMDGSPASDDAAIKIIKVWPDRCFISAEHAGQAKLKCVVDNDPTKTADAEMFINDGTVEGAAILTIQGEYSGARTAVIPAGTTVNLMAINNTDKAAKEVSSWFSSDESVAEVDKYGHVTAKGPGTAKIYAVLK